LNGGFGSGIKSIFTRGEKFFEVSNHLGNVLATVNDRRIQVDANSDGTVDSYKADIVSANDYYPFGMDMPGRQYSSTTSYRYGFNGKEKDKEVVQYDYGFRIYDPRLARFNSIDPITKNYPELTPYQFASNTPIGAIDLDGLEAKVSIENNTYFVKLENVTFRFVLRHSNQTFTQATRGFPQHDFSINTQMFDRKSYFDYLSAGYSKTPSNVKDYTRQGYNIAHGKTISGRSANETFYIAQDKSNKWSVGYGDVPQNANWGIGGGTPIIVNGLKFGETNIYKATAPDRVKNVGEKGWVDPADWQYLDQKSNGVYAGQNISSIGKTILGINSKTNQFIIVSQQNGTQGFSLDQIRDRLAKQGYNNIVAFDGSTSSTLVENGKVKVSPDQRKNNTIPSGLNLSVPDNK